MIPKIIHYCWVGNNPLSETAVKCIETWRQYCPDYEIKEWNENNYNFEKHPYMKAAYKAKRWGFVPDYARLDIIYNYGGIYMDTDVELIKPLDELLDSNGYVGMEELGRVNLGQGFAAEKNNPIIKKMRDQYDSITFINDYKYLEKHASPLYQTEILKEYGLTAENSIQNLGELTVYPPEFFCPKNMDTGLLHMTRNTYSIHHFDGSWADEIIRYGYHLKWRCIERYGRIVGRILYYIRYSIYIIRNDGMKGLIKKLSDKIIR